MLIVTFCTLLLIYITQTVPTVSQSSILNGFDDSILFKLNWPGKGYDIKHSQLPVESIIIKTHNNEKYNCTLPRLIEKEEGFVEEYNGPSAQKLLAPLFQLSTCSSRLESYWTYEICHGKFVKQYHEERDGKKPVIQEYYLGYWEKFIPSELEEKTDKEKPEEPSTPPVKKLDGVNLPYYQLNFTGGTICDLSDKPRETHVLYVCYKHGKNEIYSIKEVSTCVYEMIVLTALLCQHPKYRPQETGEHDIVCLPLDGSPKKPLSLMQLEAESLKQRHYIPFTDDKNEKLFSVYSIEEYKDKHGRKQVRVELLPLEGDDIDFDIEALQSPRSEEPTTATEGSQDDNVVNVPAVHPPPSPPPLPIQEFLSGKDCLLGGSGWWKFKFCFGLYVEQYHIEKALDGTLHKTDISLGVFDHEAHIEWLKRNPHKRPKPLEVRRQFSHFYSGGSYCEKSGRPRETEVKLKCVEKKGTVSLYLLEPHICQYELGVESPLICELLDKIDEHGLVIEQNKNINNVGKP